MLRLMTLALWLALLSACAAPHVRENLLTGHTYAPTKHVATLLAWPSDRKYVAIAELEALDSGFTSEEALNVLKARAKELGADAIVWGAKHPGGGVYQELGGLGLEHSDVIRYAVAIKYVH